MHQLIFFSNEKQKIQPFLEKFLSSNSVQIQRYRWEEMQLSKLCPVIAQWKVESLKIHLNSMKTIIEQIKQISFPNLKTLYLYENQIQNIQQLGRIHIPFLETVLLCVNVIRSIKVLRKAKWTFLQCLEIGNNYIIDGEYLTEMKLKCLKFVALQSSKCVQFSNKSFVLKLETKEMKRICKNG